MIYKSLGISKFIRKSHFKTLLLSIALLLVTALFFTACSTGAASVTKPASNGDIKSSSSELAEAASCKILSLVISPAEIITGQPVTIRAAIANSGNERSNYLAELRINNSIEEIKTLVIPGGIIQNIDFWVYKDIPGDYQVTLGDLIGKFTVADQVGSAQTNNTGTAVLSCCDDADQPGGSSSSSCCGAQSPPQPASPQYSKPKSGGCCG